ncbi:hypothetical protein K1W54_02360 [Micromonospora sp. CPCC 205371]|nr:hypothetical protein [Micromonospora sp. CPCC 205371]
MVGADLSLAMVAAARQRFPPDRHPNLTFLAVDVETAGAIGGAAPHVGALPPLPLGDEPGPFAFADPARIHQVLTAAGFDHVSIEAHNVVLRPVEALDTVAEWLIELGPAGPPYRAARPYQQASARAGVVRLLERFRTPGAGVRLPAGIWLITAVTPTGQPALPAGDQTPRRPTFYRS